MKYKPRRIKILQYFKAIAVILITLFWSSEIQGTGSFDRIGGKWDITWQRKIDRGNNIEMSSMTAAGVLHGSQTIAARY